MFLVGLAVILALLFGLASTAFGANEDFWKLGRGNAATNITALGGALGVNGPMLKLVNNHGGTDDTALRLEVQPQEPPMSINSTTKVNGLNADQLDGKDASQFMARQIYLRGPGQERTPPLRGDGTLLLSESCDPGDAVLSGGPASILSTSRVLDSFPASTSTWQVRIHPGQNPYPWTVVIVCVDTQQ